MRYTQKQVEDIFLQYGWILDDVYHNRSTSLRCVDNEGYLYKKSLGDVLKGKGSFRFHSKNPYTLYNIDLFLKINNITLKRLSHIYVDCKTKMKWQCECGEIFDTTFDLIQRGKHFCEPCSRSKRWDGFRDYTNILQEECRRRDYNLLTKNINRGTDLFQYICNKHQDKGVQTSTYDNMINGHCGCKWCGIEIRGKKIRLDETRLKDMAESKGFIYAGYDYENEENKAKKVNIHILCPKHLDKGIQKVKYDNLKHNSCGCKYCCGLGRTQEDLQKEIDIMHGTVDILYYNTYMDSIIVRCRICDHIWVTNGARLIQGHRCPNCNKSNFELETSTILDNHYYNYVSQKSFSDCRDINLLPFDFYLTDYDILIETDGEGHYKPIPRGSMTMEDAEMQLQIVQKHDAIKTQYCIDNNIPLIRVPYWERNNLENFLIKEIYKIIN